MYRGGLNASGTSFSAPLVAGVIALLFEKNRALTQDNIRAHLLGSATEDAFTGIVPNVNWGHGKLNAESAYDALSSVRLVSNPPFAANERSTDMKQEGNESSGQVTIRTEDEQTGFVDITVTVREGNIVEMRGVDGKGNSWEVRQIKFSGGSPERNNDECKCCQFDPGRGRVVCFDCPCDA